jgi:hypothetical protein
METFPENVQQNITYSDFSWLYLKELTYGY